MKGVRERMHLSSPAFAATLLLNSAGNPVSCSGLRAVANGLLAN